MISRKKLEKFEKQINFYFKNKENLLKALIHPSYISETKLKKTDSNFERFEFLGDRVLGLSIASLLFNKFKKSNEGDLTKRLSVKSPSLDLLNLLKSKLEIDKPKTLSPKNSNLSKLLSVFLSFVSDI